MAATRAPENRLRHILDEARAIQEVTHDLAFEAFKNTWLIRRAVEHGLLIITEAAKSLPAELKETQPSIQWQQIESFGNLLRHEYREVNSEVLWRIVDEELPKLIVAVETMLAKISH